MGSSSVAVTFINKLQMATDLLKMFGSLPRDALIAPLFIKLGQPSHKNDCLWVEEERKKETEKRRQEQQVEDEKEERSSKETILTKYFSTLRVGSIWTFSLDFFLVFSKVLTPSSNCTMALCSLFVLNILYNCFKESILTKNKESLNEEETTKCCTK